jgi:hypothetical protein
MDVRTARSVLRVEVPWRMPGAIGSGRFRCLVSADVRGFGPGAPSAYPSPSVVSGPVAAAGRLFFWAVVFWAVVFLASGQGAPTSGKG